jgi:D-alanine-D-alanine ligase
LVKPNYGGSSVGIGPESIVEDSAELAGVVAEELARYRQPCLIEGFVRGVDVTVGLLGNGEVEAFPPGYIIAAGGLYSATVKQTHQREIVCPCRLPAGLKEQLAEWSRAIYGLIGCRDFARVDYMVDDKGRPYFLEINPLPGLSPYYGIYPVLGEAAGYDHTALIGRIMELALARPRYTRSLTHERMAR